MPCCRKKKAEESPKCPTSCSGSTEGMTPRATSTPVHSMEELDFTFNASQMSNVPQKYQPWPYIFRTSITQQDSFKDSLIKCPPFYLQLDHTIAVIWGLFTKTKIGKELGIVQLQWALGFLRNVRTVDGDYTKDVRLCINAVQDTLVDLYAEMVDEIKKIPKRSKGCKPSCTKSSSASLSSSRDATFPDNYVPKRIPFSINYADMHSKNESVSPDQKKKRSKTKSCTSGSSTGGQASKGNETMQMTEFLSNWRNEQIQKIEAELKRLHSIENFIAQTNRKNFQPYVDAGSIDKLSRSKEKCPGDRGKKSCAGKRSTESNRSK